MSTATARRDCVCGDHLTRCARGYYPPRGAKPRRARARPLGDHASDPTRPQSLDSHPSRRPRAPSSRRGGGRGAFEICYPPKRATPRRARARPPGDHASSPTHGHHRSILTCCAVRATRRRVRRSRDAVRPTVSPSEACDAAPCTRSTARGSCFGSFEPNPWPPSLDSHLLRRPRDATACAAIM